MAEYLSGNHPTKRKKNGKAQSYPIHRVIWMQQQGEIPKGFMVHHLNGDKKDNRVENLICVSRKDHAKLHHKEGRIRITYPSGAIEVIKSSHNPLKSSHNPLKSSHNPLKSSIKKFAQSIKKFAQSKVIKRQRSNVIILL